MAVNLLELLDSELPSDVLSKIAFFVGQGPATTRGALTGAVPAVLCALHQRVGAAGGSAELLGILKDSGFEASADRVPADVVGSADGLADLVKVGRPLVTVLFGTHESGVIDWLSRVTGINTAGGAALLALVVPFMLQLIRRQLGGSGALSESAVSNLIRGQGSYLAERAPASLAPVLGLGQCGETSASASPATAAAPPVVSAAALPQAAPVAAATPTVRVPPVVPKTPVPAAYAAVSAAPAAVGAVKAQTGVLGWLLPLLVLLVLAGLYGWWDMQQPQSVTAPTGQPAVQ
jgi:OmpA-OmpF porin, OOP family